MKRYLGLGLLLTALIGLSAGFSSSTTFIQNGGVCDGTGVGEAEVNTSVDNETVTVEGLYCANTGGYAVVEEVIENENGELEASIVIEGPDEDEMVTQVITPVEFNVSEQLESGEYDLTYEVEVEDEVVESGEEEVQIGEVEETEGLIASISNWFSGLF